MSPVFVALLALFAATFQTRAAHQAEIAALRHQIVVLQRSAPASSPPQAVRPPALDCVVSLLARLATLCVHREAGYGRPLASQGVRSLLDWKSRRRSGRPAVAAAIRDLIQRMSRANVHPKLSRFSDFVFPSDCPGTSANPLRTALRRRARRFGTGKCRLLVITATTGLRQSHHTRC